MNIQTFDFSVDLLQALLWQHNKAERLQALLSSKQAWYDENQQRFWEDWQRDVFDLTTANEFGLSVWAQILGIPLVVANDPDAADKISWGFGANHENFNNGNFAASSSGQALSVEQQRLVLRLRYFQLTTRGAAPEINEFLAHLFGEGFVYVVDGLNMTALYVFSNTPDANLAFILTQYDVLPRPAGVSVSFIVNTEDQSFGFGPAHANYTNGNFNNG